MVEYTLRYERAHILHSQSTATTLSLIYHFTKLSLLTKAQYVGEFEFSSHFIYCAYT